ncbi:TetR-like C-terminal domain-containing protein [Streptomyces sp. RGM 3693]|uniref:TetR-like C-terminal domain-containing protein n=1 Tax=Streptomyces sp. RGM 3693 TaxID=3413284 RepID=UPI003D2D17E5
MPDEPPDTGDLRGDVLALLHRVVTRTQELAPVREVLAAEQGQATELSAYLASRNQGPGHAWMRIALERAARRGQIDAPDALPDRLVTLPVVLVVHDLFMAHRTPTDADLEEIVDQLFLPLVTHQRGQLP